MVDYLARIAAFVVGVLLVQSVLRSAIRTVVVPQGEQVRLSRFVFLAVRQVFDLLAVRHRSYRAQARVFSRYAPMALMTLLASWAVLIIVGFIPLYWAAGVHDLRTCVALSGSSVTTLGFIDPVGPLETLLSIAEGLLGLGLVALMISYLPTLYTLFNRREAQVVKLDVRAGSPPTAVEMLTRFQRIGWLHSIDDQWEDWEEWFTELEESHTSHPALVFFRSQRVDSSWITGAGCVLDTMAIIVSCLDLPHNPQAAVTLRSGYLALNAIARFYGVPLAKTVRSNDPISIRRAEFDLLWHTLAGAEMPLTADREAAWRAFAGWRVNYDTALLALCRLCNAPPTPWSSDRLQRFHRPTVFHPHFHVDPPDTPPSW